MNVAAVALESNQEEKDISKHIKVRVSGRKKFVCLTLHAFIVLRLTLIKNMVQHGIASLGVTSELL